MPPVTDTIRVDWDALKAAKAKLRKATAEAERLSGGVRPDDILHSLYKCGSFLDEALNGAFSKLDEVERLESA